MDFETASKTSGARFVFLKGNLARLERAISDYISGMTDRFAINLYKKIK